MMKKTFLMFILSVALSGTAFAFHCPVDMKKIDDALANSPTISEAELDEVKALRALGEEQHNSGSHAEAVATLAEAMKILGIE